MSITINAIPPTPHLHLAPIADEGVGAPVVFEVLFARYSGYVAGLAARLLVAGDSEVDDVVQDVFWLASRRAGKIRDLIQARGWLATVTIRVVRRRLMRRRFRGLFLASRSDIDVPARGATADELAILTRLYEVLDGLRSDQRLAWTLRYLQGEAADAFARARAAGGPLAEDALAREVEAASRAGDITRSRELARKYQTRYPDGRRAKAVSRFGGLD